MKKNLTCIDSFTSNFRDIVYVTYAFISNELVVLYYTVREEDDIYSLNVGDSYDCVIGLKKGKPFVQAVCGE